MAKYLIMNADDLGYSELVNTGIMEAHSFGTVTSSSLMANMPAFQQAVGWALRTPSLGVGLHFNLTCGTAIAPPECVPSLAGGDGSFSGQRHVWREAEIEVELNHQFNKLVTAGIMPTHLDSHHHTHLEVPQVYAAMKSFAQQRNIPMRLHPWSNDPIRRPLRTDRLIMATYDADDGLTRLLHHIHHLHEGTTEIMCHPRYLEVDHPLRIASEAKDGELRALTSPSLRYAIRVQRIRLIHFRHLAKVS
ncbi:ChbG/HpnK family deacetylase [Paenibacillus thiaminolyticus]|uniref:carbohydrate deacetylase n=1 Tax=Paenibacillus thiaminolyticus TaxID=49283 RepID=UPI0013F5F404|nr:ChbG/HpnK family deacetylase [Paenibacillus thiaminolyticus]NGP60819.1 ChbG/HpnK family deacetylase [Paenibacillus thiaminolyticus]